MDPRPILDSLETPQDLAAIPSDQLPVLAAEIRSELLDVVRRQGGHLASNLGVVELSISLLRAFDLSEDKIVWDTGHQGYVYKLLTGRRKLLQSLRADGGCCGFLHRDESPHDVFGAGHAGTAISAALGLAAARDRRGGTGKVVAVVGDGALGCGVALEGLNSIIETTSDFVLVLNDNKMSIAPNVGALARYLNRIISTEGYNRFKGWVRRLVLRIPRLGPAIHRGVRRIEEATKSFLVPGVWFEELGLRYIGPLDGHDLQQMVRTFTSLRQFSGPLVVHVLTQKGRGHQPAEEEPEVFHGVSRPAVVVDKLGAANSTNGGGEKFSATFGAALCRVMESDPAVVVITAGMCMGTGLEAARQQFPERFFDVGIAEEHAVVFAAGLASAGMKPMVAIYASFMQRAMDYVFHDVCLQNLPVCFFLDRAGIVDDGPTHHGVHDLGFWRGLPNLSVLQPADAVEQEQMLQAMVEYGGPVLMRYPKGAAGRLPTPDRRPLEWGRAEQVRSGADVAVWALGRETAGALEAAEMLAQRGIEATVVNPRFLMPFDAALLQEQARQGTPLVTIENHCICGGLATTVKEVLAELPGENPRLHCFAWPREVLPWGSEQGIRRHLGLAPDQIADGIEQFVRAAPTSET